MAVSLAPIAKQRFFDSNGDPLAGGKLYTYEAGTTTPKATYTDYTGGTPNANPVVLDANGEADVWISTGYYKFVLKNSSDVTQWTEDYVSLPIIENGFSTGDVKLTIKTTADSGWVLMNDLTIGNASSSATGRANADTEDLFTLLWNNTANAQCAVSTGRGVSAAADYAANKTIALPKSLGRALAIYGSGSGLTARAMAETLGAETHQLTSAEMPSHTHTQNSHNHTQDAHGHQIRAGQNTPTGAASARGFAGYDTYNTTITNFLDGAAAIVVATATNQAATATNQNTGGDGSHNNMQPTLFLNVMIKL